MFELDTKLWVQRAKASDSALTVTYAIVNLLLKYMYAIYIREYQTNVWFQHYDSAVCEYISVTDELIK